MGSWRRSGPGLCPRLALRLDVRIAPGSALAGGQALPPLAALWLLLLGWETDRKSWRGRACFGTVHCALSITLPVEEPGQLLRSHHRGWAQLQGHAVIITHPLKRATPPAT